MERLGRVAVAVVAVVAVVVEVEASGDKRYFYNGLIKICVVP
jgi:hypothetical protein